MERSKNLAGWLLAAGLSMGWALAEVPARPAPRTWTVMVYQVPDDGGTGFGDVAVESLRQVGRAVGTDRIKVVVQVDRCARTTRIQDGFFGRSDYRGIERFVYDFDMATRRGGWSRAGRVAGENSGDPATLADFMAWAARTYPAQRYGLMIESHGSGPMSWSGPGSAGAPAPPPPAVRPPVLAAAEPDGGASLLGTGDFAFVSTGLPEAGVGEESLTGIGSDSVTGDAAGDDLTWPELASVFRDFRAASGVKLGVLGLFGCLGGSLEALYELRDGVEFVGASPTYEWFATAYGFEPFLAELSRQPELGAGTMAMVMARNFTDSARRNGTDEIFYSWDMELVGELGRATSALAGALVREERKGPVGYGRLSVHYDYGQGSEQSLWDLYEICGNLAEGRATLVDQVDAADLAAKARAVRTLIQRARRAGAHTNGWRGYEAAAGLAIYWPARRVTLAGRSALDRWQGLDGYRRRDFYRTLALATDTGWDEMIDAHLGLPVPPPAPRAAGAGPEGIDPRAGAVAGEVGEAGVEASVQGVEL